MKAVPLTLVLLIGFGLNLGAKPVTPPLAAPPVASSSAQAEAALRAGQKCLLEGNESGAELAWREGLKRGEDSGLLYALGGLQFQAGRLQQAEVCFQRLVQLTPDLSDGWYQLGLVRAARGRYKDAADAQRLAVSHSPRFGQAYCALALDLRETGQVAEGLQAVEKSVEILPLYAGAWNLRANLKQDQGNFEAAALDYAAALRLQPRYAGAWFNRAQLQEKRGQKSEALKGYTYALQVKPEFAEAWLARGELHLDQADLQAADLDFRAVTRLSGWEPEAWWGLARVAKAGHQKSEEADCLVRYRTAIRRRDRHLAAERDKGIERPSAYEPGLPLALSQAPL